MKHRIKIPEEFGVRSDLLAWVMVVSNLFVVLSAGVIAWNFGAWWAMWGPPGMPAELTRTINGWVNEAVKELGAEGRLAALGIEPSAETPQAFAEFIKADIDRSSTLLKAANFQPE